MNFLNEMYNDLKQIVDPRYSTYQFLNKYFPNGTFCELGVFAGDNLKKMLLECNPKMLYGIDVFEDVGKVTVTDNVQQSTYDNYYADLLDFEEHHSNLKLVKGYTYNAVSQFQDNSFDFLYIDADHSYEGVSTDLNDWFCKVKENGIIAGHDYFNWTSAYKFGVVEAVNEFISKHNVQYFHITPESFAPSWYMIRSGF